MTKTHFSPLRSLASALFFVLCLLPFATHATSLADITALINQRQYAPALAALEPYLATNPTDAQGRFLKGVALGELNQPAEAIAVFTSLTEDFPEMPEPYNNLAVIYAKQNQLENARRALEMAIRTNPSYATAHENLGDIYARLASQAYSQAKQLDAANTSAQRKLTLLNSLTNP
ncbi:MAG: tetratricopeptide repeat protein [Rugosibacter sp.]|nr:tetratricopeptide repeat protein [Rugosibacter sp.]